MAVLLGAVFCIVARYAPAQELEPRRWSHLPAGFHSLGAGLAYSETDIFLDPVLRLEDAQADIYTLGLKYLQTFDLFGKLARLDIAQPLQDGHWEGLLDGEKVAVDRQGMADPSFRFSVNLYGSPPLRGKEFAAYRAGLTSETIVGAGVAVHAPLGQYYEDKLINLGGNRFVFRSQLGLVHSRGKWTGELTGAAWFFTDNEDFRGGLRREQDPLFTAQGHLIYTLMPGVWVGASAGVNTGGESTVNGRHQHDRQENLGWAVSVGVPFSRRAGMKVSWIESHTQETIGQDTRTLMVAAAYQW